MLIAQDAATDASDNASTASNDGFKTTIHGRIIPTIPNARHGHAYEQLNDGYGYGRYGLRDGYASLERSRVWIHGEPTIPERSRWHVGSDLLRFIHEYTSSCQCNHNVCIVIVFMCDTCDTDRRGTQIDVVCDCTTDVPAQPVSAVSFHRS